MKLKKIASLALAGIMAVSMLAGCKYGEGSSSSSSSSEVTATPTSGFAAALNDVRSAYTKDIAQLTYTDSSSLTEILQTAAEDEFGKNTKYISDNSGYKTPTLVSTTTYAKLYQSIVDKLVGNVGYATVPTTIGSDKGTTKALQLYVMGGDYTMATVANGISSSYLNPTGNKMAVVTGSNALKAYYSADVAAVKIVSPDTAEKSMWIVAVVYTQTVKD